ncbi:MAG: hypothetical protein ED559_04060 [Phycisphaera sp.]|nr:MAG: hypothetical protein ED559_04060 [Phycisphaera sp.]
MTTDNKDTRRRFIEQTERGTREIANEIAKHPDPRAALDKLYTQTIEQIWADHESGTEDA